MKHAGQGKDGASTGGGGGGGARGKNTRKGKGKKGGGAASATPSVRDCANCGAPEGSIPGSPTHYACGRCLLAYYCSTECQKTHWKKGQAETTWSNLNDNHFLVVFIARKYL